MPCPSKRSQLKLEEEHQNTPLFASTCFPIISGCFSAPGENPPPPQSSRIRCAVRGDDGVGDDSPEGPEAGHARSEDRVPGGRVPGGRTGSSITGLRRWSAADRALTSPRMDFIQPCWSVHTANAFTVRPPRHPRVRERSRPIQSERVGFGHVDCGGGVGSADASRSADLARTGWTTGYEFDSTHGTFGLGRVRRLGRSRRLAEAGWLVRCSVFFFAHLQSRVIWSSSSNARLPSRKGGDFSPPVR